MGSLYLPEVSVVFIVLMQDQLEHVVEKGVFKARLSYFRARFEVRILVHGDAVSGFDQVFPEGHYGLASARLIPVLEVPKGSVRYLNIALNEVLRNARLELVELSLQDDVILAIFEEIGREHRGAAAVFRRRRLSLCLRVAIKLLAILLQFVLELLKETGHCQPVPIKRLQVPGIGLVK